MALGRKRKAKRAKRTLRNQLKATQYGPATRTAATGGHLRHRRRPHHLRPLQAMDQVAQEGRAAAAHGHRHLRLVLRHHKHQYQSNLFRNTILKYWPSQSRDDRCAHPPSYTHIKPAESVVEYVIRYSIATPDKIAVEWFPDLESVDLNDVKPAEYITYAELHRRSNQFARYLVEQGVQREDRVAICGNRDVNFHIVMFGILKAGGCYVPVRYYKHSLFFVKIF